MKVGAFLKNIMLAALAITSLTSYGKANLGEQYFFKDGFYAPTYGELAVLTTSEYFDKTISLLNLKAGMHLYPGFSLGIVARGFNHGHSHAEDGKIYLSGLVFEYLYRSGPVRPHLSVGYLFGEERSNEVDSDIEKVVNIRQIEVEALLGYHLPGGQVELVAGYNHGFNRKTAHLDLLRNKQRVIEPLGDENAPSQQGAFIAGVRMTGF